MKTAHLLITLAAIVMTAAGCREGKSVLPNVSGKAGEVIVVMDRNDWDSNLGSATRDLLAGDYPYLPQREPLFSLSNVPTTGFLDLFKVTAI